MDHAISQLADYMRATIDLNRNMGVSNKEMKEEIHVYVKAINELEIYYYGKAKTKLETVLN